MQSRKTITLSNFCVEAIQNDDMMKLDYLFDELSRHNAISSILSHYHSGASVTFAIDQGSLDVDTDGHGAFSVDYTKHVYSACKDIDLDEDHDMLITIEINMLTTEAILTGEFLPEREPDTY